MKLAIVYRMYDAADELLYIGTSSRGLARIDEHVNKEWWRDIATVKVEHFETADEALRAEQSAIRAERPRYNRPPGARKIAPTFVTPEIRHFRVGLHWALRYNEMGAGTLSVRSGVNLRAMRALVDGKREPTWDEATAIAEVLRCQVSDLCTIQEVAA